MKLFAVAIVIFFSGLCLAAEPSWYVAPPESGEKFYFLAEATATVKKNALVSAHRNIIVKASSYLGSYFDRKKLTLINEGYLKDLKTDIHTCYILVSYPRSDRRNKQFSEQWDKREINRIFNRAVKNSKKLASKDRIIAAIRVISFAVADKRLPEVNKEELANMLKEFVTRVKIRPLEYPRAADTQSGLRGELGVIVSVSGRDRKPVAGINVDFKFVKNSGYIQPASAITDKKGLVAVKVIRINNPGPAQISAGISSASVPEFTLVQSALFDIEVKGRRTSILKAALPLSRGGTKKQSIIILGDNTPIGVMAFNVVLRPDELVVTAKITPTKDITGFSIDKQVNVEGVELIEVSKDFSIKIDKLAEKKKYKLQAKPFEIIFYTEKINREKIDHPLQGEIDTIKNLMFKYIIYYL